MGAGSRWVSGVVVALMGLGTVAAAPGGAPETSTEAWVGRFLEGRPALVEEVPGLGTTPMLERYGRALEAAAGAGDSSVATVRLAMTLGIERLGKDFEGGGAWPAPGSVPPWAVEGLGRRVDPARVRACVGRILGLRWGLVPVHGAEMGVRSRLVSLSLLRQVFVADAAAGLFPDPLGVRGRRDLLELLDGLLVSFSTDDRAGRGLPADLREAGQARLAWFDGIFPLMARRVAQTPSALTSLVRALSARAARRDRLDEDELARFERLAREALPPPEVFALPPRERLQALEAWRPHLNARTREGPLWPGEAEGDGPGGDRPRALLSSLLAGLELTDDCARELRMHAHVRALAVAWGASGYRRLHEGRPPSTWAELEPFVPPGLGCDPINGGFLRFAPDGPGTLTVWSDGFRGTPGGWGGDEGCVDLVPRYGDRWGGLLP